MAPDSPGSSDAAPRGAAAAFLLPLTALTADVARAVAGVVFDVDDTVTREGRLEREAFDALWALADAGLPLVAATGRPLGWCEVLVRQWPVVAVVGENGAGWLWRTPDGDVAHDYGISAEARRALPALFARVEREVRAAVPHVTLAPDQAARRCDLAFDVGERARLDPADRARVVAAIEALGLRAVVSSVHAHASPGTHDKATGACAALAAALGVARDEALATFLFVGDSGNDAAAFEAFAITAAPANVRASLGVLRRPPRFVADADRGRGFAEIAARLLALRAEPEAPR
jgi:HAD superfamily hydrolase (TIGR01484 family)